MICPYCLVDNTNHLTLDGEENWHEGELSFCLDCGEVGEFRNDVVIKIDVNTLDPETRRELKRVEGHWLRMRAQQGVKT